MTATWDLRPGMLLTLMMSALLLLVGVWITNGVVAKGSWPIRAVQIEGEFKRIAAEQVKSIVAPAVDGNFFSIDLESIRQSAEAQPWIKQAVVRKIWPDKVQVRIVEYVALAHWSPTELIDDSGEIFIVPRADQLKGIPWLTGPKGSEISVLKAFAKIQKLLEGSGYQLRHLDLNPHGFWQLGLSGDLQVLVTRGELDVSLKKFVGLQNMMSEKYPAGLKSVDLRYPNGMAIRPHMVMQQTGG